MKETLNNQAFILGISGGVALYKSCELVRLLKKNGARVHVVMTKNATKLISPQVFQALSGEDVYTNMWNYTANISMPHIHLSRIACAILIAPATANFIAKIANGIADDLLSSICLSRSVPLVIAPAMNVEMWNNSATQRNYKTLLQDNVHILEPNTGNQACGDNGPGRMQEPEEILAFIHNGFCFTKKPSDQKRNFKNKTVLITAGPTFEAIDPIRGITNRSSGKLGYAIAEICKNEGAKVFLVSGPVSISAPPSVHVLNIESADQMLKKVRKILEDEDIDIFFSVAAVSDWTPKKFSKNKIKKNSDSDFKNINWIQTKDIIYEVASIRNKKRPFVVGFAAETVADKLFSEICQKKLTEKKADMLIGTNGPKTFGSDHADMLICMPNQENINVSGTKKQIATKIIQLIKDKFF